MAVTPTFAKGRGPTGGIDALIVTWAALVGDGAGGTTGIGVGVKRSDLADRTVQFTGTFNTTTIILEGSNDSTTGSDGTWGQLSTPQGTAISATAAAGPTQVTEACLWIRPRVSVGTGGSHNAIVCARRSVR